MSTTASYYPELTNLLKEICEDITRDIIKEGQPILIVGEFEWYREVLSLLAKQVNLCDSCMLLLENGMEQEAYLLARSQFNNMLWIKYMCEGEDNSRVKEYYYQPHINQILKNKNLKKLINDYSDELDSRFKEESILGNLDKNIEDNKDILDKEGISIKPKSIAELAKQDATLFGMYITMYNEGSQFEHSDISKTKLYRKPAIEEYSSDSVFVFDLSRSDEACWLSVFRCSFMSIYFSFESIYNRIVNKEEQLFWDTKLTDAAYKEEVFKSILFKIAKCQNDLKDI